MSWQPTTSWEALRQRAAILSQIRRFFAVRAVLEVETPTLSRFATTDPAIESLATQVMGRDRYLHTSPEFPMKRLIAAGSGDIYQICKVFRDDESGRFHNPEFTLLEWYRLGINHLQLIDELLDLLRTLAEQQKMTVSTAQFSYRDLFWNTFELDPLKCDSDALEQCAVALNLHPDCSLSKDGWLDLLLSQEIVEHFPDSQLTSVVDYPASQAALARLNPDGKTAARFEVFWGQHELANGFWELTDAAEQRRRFADDVQMRVRNGQQPLPIDEALLFALEQGLPTCAGVAMGVDRLVMKLLGAEHINAVIAFPEGSA